MHDIKISVIIPIYNQDPIKLRRCIESVRKIKCSCELILIDDGSDEYVRSICLEFVKTDHRIVYRYQENQGVSNARNHGIDISKGEYVIFVDSDDELIFNNIDLTGRTEDLVFFDYAVKTRRRRQVIRPFSNTPKGVIPIEEAFKIVIETQLLNKVTAKLFKGTILRNSVFFDSSLVHGEDLYFVLAVLEKASCVYYYPTTIYEYNYSENTYIERAVKHKLKIVDNLEMIVQKREMLTYQLNVEDRAIAIEQINRYLTSSLFKHASNLIIRWEYDKNSKKRIAEATRGTKLSRSRGFIDKEFLKYKVLSTESILIYPLAFIRYLYLLIEKI